MSNKEYHVVMVVGEPSPSPAALIAGVMACLRKQGIPVLEVRGGEDLGPALREVLQERNELVSQNHHLRGQIAAAQRTLGAEDEEGT